MDDYRIEVASDGSEDPYEVQHYTIVARVREFSNVSIHKPSSQTSEDYVDYDFSCKDFQSVFPVTIYANGYNIITQGSVSMMFSPIEYISKEQYSFYMELELNCMVEVVDAESDRRFMQSYVFFRDFSKYQPWQEEKYASFNIDGYISRNFLIKNQSELLPNDTLTLHIDIVLKKLLQYSKPVPVSDWEFTLSSYKTKNGWEGPGHYLHMNSPMAKILRNQSKYLERKLDAWVDEKYTSYIRIPRQEHYTFEYVRKWLTGDAHFYGVLLYDALDIYSVAQKYRMTNIVDSYRNLLAYFICRETVAEVSVLAEKFDDYILRTVAEDFRGQELIDPLGFLPLTTKDDCQERLPNFKTEVGLDGTRHYLHLDSPLAKFLFIRSRYLDRMSDTVMPENSSRYMRISDEEYPIFLKMETLYKDEDDPYSRLLHRALGVYASIQRYGMVNVVDSYRKLLKHFACRKILSEILDLEVMFDDDTLRKQVENIPRKENDRCKIPENETKSQSNVIKNEVRTGEDTSLVSPRYENTMKDNEEKTYSHLRYGRRPSSLSEFLAENFKTEESPDGPRHYLYLDSPMTKLLSKQSEYFERIPDVPMVENRSRYMWIPDEEFPSFLKIGAWLMSGESYYGVLFSDDLKTYVLAQKYHMQNEIASCGELFHTHICREIVSELSELVETYNDDFLRETVENFLRIEDEKRAILEDESKSGANGTDDEMRIDEEENPQRRYLKGILHFEKQITDDEQNKHKVFEAVKNENDRDFYNFYS